MISMPSRSWASALSIARPTSVERLSVGIAIVNAGDAVTLATRATRGIAIASLDGLPRHFPQATARQLVDDVALSDRLEAMRNDEDRLPLG